MADTKISALPAATLPLAGTEVLPIVQGGITEKVAVDDLTVKNIRSNATTGLLQVAGPAASTTRVMTTPNANFTAARTDAAQTFTGRQSINGAIGLSNILEGYSTSYETLAAFRSVPGDGINPYFLITSSANGITLEQNGSAYRSLILKTGAADRVTVAAGGDVTVNTGNLIQGAAAKGVNFTANTPAAGMTSQLLNWYEEGTWTPDLLIAGGNTGITYTSRSGRYTRNGRLVEVECSVVLSSKGARTGVVRVGGLPFTPGIDVLPATIVPTGTWASLVAGGSIQAYISGTAVYLLLGTTTGTTGLTDVNLSNTSAFTFTATFSV